MTTNGTLDTSKLSTVVVYTYTADDDTAGNPGMSINRTVSDGADIIESIISNSACNYKSSRNDVHATIRDIIGCSSIFLNICII